MFCGACGKPLSEEVKFCPECGAPVRRAPERTAAPASPPQPAVPPVAAAPVPDPQPTAAAPVVAAAPMGNVEQALLIAPFLIGGAALLILMAGDIFDFGLGLVLAGVTYAVGYQNFKQGKLKQAKTGALVMGIIAGVGALIGVGVGNMLLVLLDAAAGTALIFASTKL